MAAVRPLPCPPRAAETEQQQIGPPEPVGEDAAIFSLEQQSSRSWALFVVLLVAVSAGLYGVRWQQIVPGQCWGCAPVSWPVQCCCRMMCPPASPKQPPFQPPPPPAKHRPGLHRASVWVKTL